MKHTKHEDRKSFDKWAQPGRVAATTHPDHLPHHKTPATSTPAIMESRVIPYRPASIRSQPGTERDVLTLQRRKVNSLGITTDTPLYRRSRDGGVRRMPHNPQDELISRQKLGKPIVIRGEVIRGERYTDRFQG